MDRKDHIVATADCRPRAKQFIPFANEAFLVTLANKGLYKRALKDLEACAEIRLSADGGLLRVGLEDVVVTLDPNVSQSGCSCPSKTVCKHILMAILSVAGYAEDESREVAEAAVPEASLPHEDAASLPPSEADWESLRQADIAALRKQAGKRLFEDALSLIQEGWAAEFKEGDMLEATINTENITVYFPRQDSLNRAVCKCGSGGLCKHKLVAILSFLSRQGDISDFADEAVSISFLTEETRKVVADADAFILRVIDKGLIGCGENEAEAAIQYSIRMETCGIGNLARQLRSFSSDLENMRGKNIGFSPITTLATLARLHNTMRLILGNSRNSEWIGQLIETTRSDYYTTPVGHFTGLGAYPWKTRSGYFGMTAYFYYEEKKSICTYTVSMAGYYEQTERLVTFDNLSRQFMKAYHWGGSFSLSQLSRAVFILRNFKLNRQNRLSSANQTQCELTGTTDGELLRSFPAAHPLFQTLEDGASPCYDYFEKRKPEEIVLVPFLRLSDAYFNHAEQILSFTLEKENEEPVARGKLDFNELNERAIRSLERMSRSKESKRQYMAMRENRGDLEPVSLIDEQGITNFFF